ncbi:MAG: tRNA uridine-5-carboxymethylaminomethyl(34) synthesis GTPase MnmE [bacterium]|nr:tRNA uridine-5-carboxymethylaminomethyl(34) synthesis GTPase MnmE [bacterium]
MISNIDDTISAIATVLGTGGVSIIRLSGKDAQKVIDKIFFINKNFLEADFKPNSITHGYIYDNKILLDEVIVLYFQAPHSYTGEDVFEIQCHGGVNITQAIFDLTLKNGARIADRGEFTKRAFLNGKLDLSQAESVLDIISAKTKKFAQKSATNLTGKLSGKIEEIRGRIIELLSHIVAAIDFPEEVDEPDYNAISDEISSISEEIDTVLKCSNSSNLLRQGIKISIAGKPNVGKSSLFNNILNYERAIVTDIAGTTRDIINESIDINGIPVTITDTAGIREIFDDSDANKVENIGIKYSKRSIEEADLVIFLTDLSTPQAKEDEEIFELIKNKKMIVAGTKADLPRQNATIKTDIEISNINKSGIEELLEKIAQVTVSGIETAGTEFFTNERQQEALENAKASLLKAKNSSDNMCEQDFIAIDIKSALMRLGEITGDDITQEILNNIFEKFCIGK